MEQSPSREANTHSATQEISRLLWNPKINYPVPKNPPLVPILRQMRPVHTLPSYFPKIHANIILPSTPWSSLQVFQPKYCMHFSSLSSVLHVPPISSSVILDIIKKGELIFKYMSSVPQVHPSSSITRWLAPWTECFWRRLYSLSNSGDFPPCMEPERSLSCSQEPATGICTLSPNSEREICHVIASQRLNKSQLM